MLICAEYSDPELHRHSAAHIMISLDDKIEIVTENKKILCRRVLIPSKMIHTANTNGNRVLVFLFDNTTSVGNQISEVNVISDEGIEKIIKAYHCFENSDKSVMDYSHFIQCVYSTTAINLMELSVTDTRIESALAQSRLHEKITCADVANQAFLSEGRFSHLFKKQIGMTFASYLTYQRVVRTYVEILNGKCITTASLDAGFSSSAHFAETNKRVFGLSASIIKKDLEFYKIAEK